LGRATQAAPGTARFLKEEDEEASSILLVARSRPAGGEKQERRRAIESEGDRSLDVERAGVGWGPRGRRMIGLEL